ncbi:MAG: hypothetical protein L3K06_04370 [Thermoplasmata archaeon]|nr:hypothetical protein [Thermoplasmata archaeon]
MTGDVYVVSQGRVLVVPDWPKAPYVPDWIRWMVINPQDPRTIYELRAFGYV